MLARARHRTAHDPHRIEGTGTKWDIDATASEKMLLSRAGTLRPSLGRTSARDVATSLAPVRWSPIRGCEDPLAAMIRATGLASLTGLSAGGTDSGGFWEGRAHAVLQALLHTAALAWLSTRVLFEWSLSPNAAMDAVGILASHGGFAPGWAESLRGMIESDPRTRDSIWMAVSQAMASLADPQVLKAVSPAPGEEFEPDRS